jgi:hypothetical protein
LQKTVLVYINYFYTKAKEIFMKKILLIVCLISFLNPANAQTCEEREAKLLYIFGGATAVVMYNSYAFVGAVADAHAKKAYETDFALQLLEEQVKFISNQLKLSDTLVNPNYVKSADDRIFFKDYIGVLKGIQLQAQHYIDFVNTQNEEKRTAYNDRRVKNWAEIKRLLGIE